MKNSGNKPEHQNTQPPICYQVRRISEGRFTISPRMRLSEGIFRDGWLKRNRNKWKRRNQSLIKEKMRKSKTQQTTKISKSYELLKANKIPTKIVQCWGGKLINGQLMEGRGRGGSDGG